MFLLLALLASLWSLVAAAANRALPFATTMLLLSSSSSTTRISHLRRAASRAFATAAKAAASSSSTPTTKNVVVVSGVRIPFATTSSIYSDQLAVDLQRLAITGLLNQTALDPAAVDYVITGNVIQEVRTSNIAREAALNAGIPVSTGAHTVAQACISANAAICAAADKILTGHASTVIAGGAETFSDVPIRLTRPIRQKLITLPKAMKKGGPLGAVRHLLKGLKAKDISLETPAIANYTTGEVMGVSSDRLSAKFGVSREEQDEYTVRSHQLAARAHADGWYQNDVIPYKGSHGGKRHQGRFHFGERRQTQTRLCQTARHPHGRQQQFSDGRGGRVAHHERGKGAGIGIQAAGVVRSLLY